MPEAPPLSGSGAGPGSGPGRPWRRWLRVAAELAFAVAVLGALGLQCSVPNTAPLAEDNPSSTAFIDLRREAADAAGQPFDLKWQWRPISAISRYLRAAVVYSEDYNFYRHDGVDWRALEHAVSADWNKGAMAIGGSTITQQLAKNLYLSPKRSVFRKLREMLIAFSLEDHLGKQRILEIYLNVVEWGRGVFGAEAAARAWFHHSAASLSPAEAIRLAIALPNPITRAPNVRDAELTKKGVRLTRMMRMQGLIDAAQERATLDELGAPSERVLTGKEAAPPAESEPQKPVTEPAHEAPPVEPRHEEPAREEPAREDPPREAPTHEDRPREEPAHEDHPLEDRPREAPAHEARPREPPAEPNPGAGRSGASY